MADTTITIEWGQNNPQTVEDVKSSLNDIENSANSASQGMMSFGDVVKTGMNMVGAVALAGAMIDGFNSIGVSSLRAKGALDTLTGGQSLQWLSQMRDATKGLVDDQTLAHEATMALSTGVVKSSEDMARLARDGSTLGLALGTDAATGINNLTRSLEMVGSVRGIRQLGMDADEVNEKYKALVKSGVDKTEAWHQAVMSVADAMTSKLEPATTGVGTAMDRIKTSISNTVTDWAEKFATALERALTAGSQLAEIIKFYDQKAMGDTSIQHMDTGTLYKPLADPAANRTQMIMSTDFLNAGDFGRVYAGMPNPNSQYNDIYKMIKGAYGNPNSKYGKIEDPLEFLKAVQGDYTAQQEDVSRSAYLRDKGSENFSNYQNGSAAPADSATLSWMRMGESAAAQQRLNDAVAEGKSMVQSWWDTANNAYSGFMAKVDQATAKARASGLAGAFGLSQSGTDKEVGSDLEAGLAGRRAAIQAADGKDSKKLTADLAQFDMEAKKAREQYALATGAATQESLKFDAIQASLTQKYQAGQLSASAYAQSLVTLAQAAKDGKTSLSDLDNLENGLPGGGGNAKKPKAGKQYGAFLGLDPEETGKGSIADKVPKDMFQPVTDGATKAQTAIDTTQSKIAGMPATVTSAAAGMAPGMNSMISQMNALTASTLAAAAAQAFLGAMNRAGGKA